MNEHEHVWKRVPADDGENLQRYTCEVCNAPGYMYMYDRIRLGSKAKVKAYKHTPKKTTDNVTAQGQRRSDGRVGGGIGWHGRNK